MSCDGSISNSFLKAVWRERSYVWLSFDRTPSFICGSIMEMCVSTTLYPVSIKSSDRSLSSDVLLPRLKSIFEIESMLRYLSSVLSSKSNSSFGSSNHKRASLHVQSMRFRTHSYEARSVLMINLVSFKEERSSTTVHSITTQSTPVLSHFSSSSLDGLGQ